MAKLIMMQGLPASGKSTKAKEIVESGSWVRVNRDLLREMLHYGKWSGKNEDMVVSCEKWLAAAALSKGISVVVDDCNLNPRNKDMWREQALACGASFQTMGIDTPMDECIQRDIGRDKAVGAHVITNMALQYDLFPKPEKGFVICDLDGTLCDLTHRLHYAKGETKNWDKFFSGIPSDTLREDTKDMLDGYHENGHKIIFVSARPEKYRAFTMDWLHRNGFYPAHDGDWMTRDGVPQVPYQALIMRPDHDKRDDTEVKQAVYDKYFAPNEEKRGYPIETVIDDRPKVIRMWQSNGLPVIDVGAGVEF